LLSTVFFVANFNLSGEPGYFDTRSNDNPLLHMWSLAVEEQFYLIWPPLLLLLLRQKSAGRARPVILALAAASILLSAYWLWKSPRLSFYHLPSRGFELLAGALLAVGVVPQPRSRALAELACWAGLILMIGPMVLYSRDTPFPGFAALPPVAGCALFIWAETSWNTRAGAVFKLRPVIFIGLISYSLYLWHWPLLCLPKNVLFRLLTPAETAACLAIAVALSILSWRFIERPFRRRGERAAYLLPVFAWKQLSLAGAAAIILSITLAGFGLFAKETGAPQRWPQATVDFLAGERQTRGDGIAQPTSYTITHRNKRDLLFETRPSGKPLSDPGAFFLWGDSHAGNFAAGLEAVLGPGTVFLIPGCIPVLNVTWMAADGRSRMEACTEFKQMAMEAIAERKPKLIVLAARWIQADGLSYELEPRFVGFLKENENDPASQAHSREVFARNLRKTVEALTATGAKVLLAGQVPEVGFNARKCFAISARLGLSESHCVAVNRDFAESQLAFVNQTLSRIAAEQPGVAVFWPLPEICDARLCYTVRDGKVLYKDSNHFAVDGSLYLANGLRKLFGEPVASAGSKGQGVPQQPSLASATMSP
jgi:hypothetical protein